MYFIILSTALTLNRHGIVKVETSHQVAAALRPLAVAGGVSGSHFQRDHRYPGTHPLISARFFALADTGVDLAGFQRVDRRLVPGWYFIPPVRAVGW